MYPRTVGQSKWKNIIGILEGEKGRREGGKKE